MSENNGMLFSSPGIDSPRISLNQESNSDWDSRSRKTSSAGSRFSSCSSSEVIDDTALNPVSRTQGREVCFELPAIQQNHGQFRSSSTVSSAVVSKLLECHRVYIDIP